MCHWGKKEMVTFQAKYFASTVNKILRRLSFPKRKSKSSYMCHWGEKVQLQNVLKQQVQLRSSRENLSRSVGFVIYFLWINVEKMEKRKEREREEKDDRTESNREQTMVSLIASAFCQHTIDVMSLQRAVRSTISLIVIYEQRQVKIRLSSNYRNAFLPRHPCLPRFSILFLRQEHF